MKKSIGLVLALLMLFMSFTSAWAETEEAEGITPYAYYAAETLPRIYINTEGGMALDDPSLVIPDEHKGMNGDITVYDYVNATVTVVGCEGYELDYVEAQVKIRGNYTSTYPKKPIRIRFAESQAMCGLNDGNALKNWVLLAEYKDPSLLRNSVAFYIANSLYSTTGNYATDFRNVEVYLNGEYNGLYVLAEQQQVSEYRVNVPEPENPKDYDQETLTEEELAKLKDGHTGYFIEYDGYYTNEKPEDTFTIRYDWVTRPDGETFMPTSEGNAETYGSEAVTVSAAENNGTPDGAAVEGNENAASDGASAGGQDNSETPTGGNNETAPAEGENGWGTSDGASASGQNDGETPAGENNEAASAEGKNGWGTSDGASAGGQNNGETPAGENNEAASAEGENGWGASDGASAGGQNDNGTSADKDTGWNASAGGQNNGGFGWGFGTDSNLGTTRKTGFTITSDFYYEEQNAFIQHTMQTVWDVIYDAVYTDHSDLTANPYHTMDDDGNYVADSSITTAYDAVASVVDIDSLIDMYIIQEICMDSDLDWSSFYFSIDMSPDGNHLLTYTAPWDFDSGLNTGSDTSTLYAVNYDNPWMVIFCGQDWFWQRLNQRWDEAMEAGVFSGALEMLDTLSRINETAYEQNLERWPSSGTEGNSDGASAGGRSETQAEAAENLRTWLETKINNVDRLINEMADKFAE